jgi:hypothetical protein
LIFACISLALIIIYVVMRRRQFNLHVTHPWNYQAKKQIHFSIVHYVYWQIDKLRLFWKSIQEFISSIGLDNDQYH